MFARISVLRSAISTPGGRSRRTPWCTEACGTSRSMHSHSGSSVRESKHAGGRVNSPATICCARSVGGSSTSFLSVRGCIGSSAAVMGVMVAYASRWPGESVLVVGVIPLTVRWLAALLIAANLLVGIGTEVGTGAAYLAHVGGLVTGWRICGWLVRWTWTAFASALRPLRTNRMTCPIPFRRDRSRGSEVNAIHVKSMRLCSRVRRPSQNAQRTRLIRICMVRVRDCRVAT